MSYKKKFTLIYGIQGKKNSQPEFQQRKGQNQVDSQIRGSEQLYYVEGKEVFC